MIKLKKLRKEKQFTQEQIGQILNIKKSQVCNIEKGISLINEDQIRKLCKALNCSADYLLGLIEEEKKD